MSYARSSRPDTERLSPRKRTVFPAAEAPSPEESPVPSEQPETLEDVQPEQSKAAWSYEVASADASTATNTAPAPSTTRALSRKISASR